MAIREKEHSDGVVELIIDAPPVNALTISDLHRLADILGSYSNRPQVKVAVLRSEGRGFVAGGDVKEVQVLEGHQGILGQASGSLEATVALHECAVPVVAAVHNYCIGLGVLLVGSCDVVLCARDTKFVLAEVDNGAAGGAIQAIGLMPDKRLRAAMFTCEPVTAEELERYGSIYAVVDGADLTDSALRLAHRIAEKPGRTVRAAKLALNASTGRPIRALYREELGYTYELNLMGDAALARERFVSGERPGYVV